MIQPRELQLDLPVELSDGVMTTTRQVWEILLASYDGDLGTIKHMASECPALLYAQYNYAPPIHFAVREGHTELVRYLLSQGAHDPAYRFYPFQESLQAVANDRGFYEIEKLLDDYAVDTSLHKHQGDNGRIVYKRTSTQKEFERAVDKNELDKVKQLLEEHPEFALDETWFWSEGILTMPAKENHREMIELLMSYGARVPGILKWTQFYYFERPDAAEFMMEKGMNPNVKSWQHVTLLHDMAQKGFLDKAKLLVRHGADLDPVDEAYQSTPLGLAARWGHPEMVDYLLQQGADPNKAGAPWATPLAWAKKKGHLKIEERLKNAGASG